MRTVRNWVALSTSIFLLCISANSVAQDDCDITDFEDSTTNTSVLGPDAVNDLLDISASTDMVVVEEGQANGSILAYNSNAFGTNGAGGENWLPGDNAKSFGNLSTLRGSASENLRIDLDTEKSVDTFSIDISDYGDWFPSGGENPRRVTLTAHASDGSTLVSDTLGINYNLNNDVFTSGLRNLSVDANAAIAYVTLEFEDLDPGVTFDNIEICFIDADDDGVDRDSDLCPGTVLDEPTSDKGLGKNRWIWNGEDWETNSNEKGGPDKDFTMEETQGCSCEQILDILVEKTGKSFDGHYKFGCSQSVIEEWIEGWYPLEVVEVPSNVVGGADSQSTLFNGEDYQFIASGVWYNKAGTESIFPVDAEYVSYDNWVSHADGPALGANQLDLQVDTTFQDWGAYSTSHDYSLDYAGSGNTANFRVFDGDWTTNTPNPGWYGDNDGSLFVGILLKLW